MHTKIVVDTSVLIQDSHYLEELIKENTLIIPSILADELDNMKEASDNKRAYNGRTGLRFIDKYEADLTFTVVDIAIGLPEGFDVNNNDNKILSIAKQMDAKIATRDRGMKIKAMACSIGIIDLEDSYDEINLLGYKVFEWDCSDEEIADKLNDLAEDDTNNIFELDINEFAILKDTNRPIFTEDGISDGYQVQAIVQWNGKKIIPLKYKDVNNTFTGKVKPRNLEQKMLFSLMQNEKITIKVCSGGYGAGKDFVMLSNALEMVEKHKYEKIIWFRNPVNVRGIKETGSLPGSFQEKLEPYSAVLDDILGASYGTEMFLQSGKLEIGNLGAVRGRTFKDSIIYLTEMQNCSPEIIQLLLSRVGEGSILVMNGDYKQIDDTKHNVSSISETVRVLHGIEKFGWVQLNKVERSPTADLARRFDEI